jgi:hypothetical protein
MPTRQQIAQYDARLFDWLDADKGTLTSPMFKITVAWHGVPDGFQLA